MAGIQRVRIQREYQGRGVQRFIDAERHWLAANAVYRNIFIRLGAPLEQGYEVITCESTEEARARLDWQFGIDVIFTFENGMRTTCQEKFLFPVPTQWGLHEFTTLTIEYMQNPEEEEAGDWFNISPQFYFVGNSHNNADEPNFWDWAFYIYPLVQLGIASGHLHCQQRACRRDGARANFRFVNRDRISQAYLLADSSGYLWIPDGQQRLF
jgi:hypothetical protein